MRIIAGEFRHRPLLANPGRTTRPITDRVKESLFARMEHLLPGARVADIFAGTGTLGLEALSRGAKCVVFIENDRSAVDLLRKNVEALQVQLQTLCWPTSALLSSFRPRRAEDFLPYDGIFFDPPYSLAADLAPGRQLFRSLERLARHGVSAPGAWLIVRTPERAQIELPAVWRPDWRLVMSNMRIEVCRKSASDGPECEPAGATEGSA